MKINALKYAVAALPLIGLTACMDFDTPADEFAATETIVNPEVKIGDADLLDYTIEPTEDEVDAAIRACDQYFALFKTAQYYLLGGKNGAPPQEHQYQYVYSLGPDNYAGYTTCTQSWGGRMSSTYSYCRDFSEGPYGRYLSMKNNLANFLNDDQSNNIVELKALALLLFDYVAQENVDIYGAIPLVDHKGNKQENPFTFDKGDDVYWTIEQNLRDINACLENFASRPDWYKAKVQAILNMWDTLTLDKSFDTWRRFANSLKLRMAMNVVKYDPTTAKKWAEEAVEAGVVESLAQTVGLNANTEFFNQHPLKVIQDGWNDVRVNASFASMLISLDHPYSKYMLGKNSNNLVNTTTGEVMNANTAIVGLRAGIFMENSQQYFSNMRVAYSKFQGEDFEWMPCYAMKWAEVDFLRAEGALRGWEMGGTAEFFYNRGIANADCGDVFAYPTGMYESYLDDYMEVEEAVPYTYVDPMDSANNIESVTKIGVKWNNSDSPETKLEKIMTQKYIAIFPYSYQAWTDIRRTGYPKIFPVLNPQAGDGSLSYGDIIRRSPLPHGDTQAGMEDVSNSGIPALGGPNLQSTRVFWDIDTPNF